MYRIIVKVYNQNMIDIVSHHQMLINVVAYQKVCDKCIAVWCWIDLNEIQVGGGRKRVCMVCGSKSYGTKINAAS